MKPFLPRQNSFFLISSFLSLIFYLSFISPIYALDMAKEMEKVNRSTLPLIVGEDIKNPTVVPTQAKNSGGFNLQAQEGKKEENPSKDFQYTAGSTICSNQGQVTAKNPWEKLLSFLGLGDKKADEFSDCVMPYNIATSEKKENTETSLVNRQCGNLPLNVCLTSNTTPTPTIGGSGGAGSGNTLFYDLPYYRTDADTSRQIDQLLPRISANMPTIVAAMLKAGWYDTYAKDYWHSVYDESLAKNWNPGFVLAIWIEETVASSVCRIRDNNCNKIRDITEKNECLVMQCSEIIDEKTKKACLKTHGIWDFGVISLGKTECDSQKFARFQDQKRVFLGLVDFYKKLSGKETVAFEEFLCRYSEGHYPCTFTINPLFMPRLKRVYDCILAPGTDVCYGLHYFRF